MKIIPQGLVISILLLSEILITEARAQDVCTDPVKALSQAKPEQEKAIEQLGKCGKPAIPKVLDVLKTSQDTGLQLAANEALGKMGTDAIAPLTQLLKDTQVADSSRKLAIDSLSDIAKSEKKARNSILETLKERQEEALVGKGRKNGYNVSADSNGSRYFHPVILSLSWSPTDET